MSLIYFADQPNANCTRCEGDCIDDSMNLVYDWSTCMGNTTCTRTVMQSYMPSCGEDDKFSDYLQVEYQCVPSKSFYFIFVLNEDSWQSWYTTISSSVKWFVWKSSFTNMFAENWNKNVIKYLKLVTIAIRVMIFVWQK